MKFPRHARLLRSPLDAAPFAAVFFLLLIFLMLGPLMPTPGLPLQLPSASNLPGIDQPSVAVAVDANGRLFFANQMVNETQLKTDLRHAAGNSRQPLTLVVQADKVVTYDQLVHLTMLARDAGIENVLLATFPRAVNSP
jgi:biopolymer transport protein ExbD